MSIKSPLYINVRLDLAFDSVRAVVFVKLSKYNSQCKQEMIIKIAGKVPAAEV